MIPVCAHCDLAIIGDPVRDEVAIAWLGAKADTYCSNDCLERAAERAAST